jgi:hypothetical protein
MSEGIWIILGAAIGVLGSMLVTWLKLEGKRDYFDKKAIKHFREMLKNRPDGLAWEEIRTLGKNIGLQDDEIKQLLFLANAEPSGTTPLRWKLRS